jgi:hypothetical protein
VTRVFLLALLALLVAPSVAQGQAASGRVTIVTRDLPVGGERTRAAPRVPSRFDLVGLRWRGSGSVRFRTRSPAGRWSGWLAPDDTNPTWTGDADRLQYRVHGRVSRLRVSYIWSPAEHSRLRRLSVAGSPPIVSRTAWGGNELLRRNQPRYAPAVRFVVVHHTATPNDYTPDEAAAIVRGIDVYHVRTNGWNDIGYNFLVDRFGRIYEGRYGGITRNVIGAHALGFNTGSVGIALIGNFMTASPPPAAVQSLERLIAWRLDLAHVDPVSTLTYVSNGSERWRKGAKVKLRAVSGHRDTGLTSCPGNQLYPQLDRIALAAEQIGLPKLYAPVVRGGIGGPVVFSARLSGALPWSITVAGPSGRRVARGTGLGPSVSWTWNAAGRAPGRYAWTMEAGPNVLPARGVVGAEAPPPPPPQPPPPPPVSPLVQGLALTPGTLSPNGDGYADQGTVSYTLSARSAVTATVVDATGAQVETLFDRQAQSARSVSFPFSPGAMLDGHYTLVVEASSSDGRSLTAAAPFTVDRALGFVTASPPSISPNGDGLDDALTASMTLAGPGQATVTILAPDGSTAATLFGGELGPGTYTFAWDGRLGDGSTAPDGQYQVEVTLLDPLGTVMQTAPFAVASAPP